MSFREVECLTIEFLEITGQKLADNLAVLLDGSESLGFRKCSTIVCKAPMWVSSGLFLPSCIKEGNKVLVE